MKNSILILTVIAATLLSTFNGCKDDEPAPVNEEEVITTFRATFTPQGGGAIAVFQFRDLDGDGGNPPVITNDTLVASNVYDVSLELFNETVSPVDTITNEVHDEATVHQFFFQPQGGLNLTFAYGDTDSDGHPVGLLSEATTAAASSGTLTITLRHEPDKHAAGVENGDITNAGGETDIEVTFNVVIQ